MRRAAGLAACLLAAGCASAERPITAPMPIEGYLDGAAVRALAADIAPSPVDPVAERALFNAVEPGTDRWWLATAHAELRPPEAAQHFDCALGTRLTAEARPALTRLMNRLLIDSAGVTNVLARQFPRRRPVAEQPELQACVRMDDASRESPSWPAGGAVAGSAYGEMFAALAPDQAGAVRRRGMEIGLSRAVCRVNWRADVVDGQRIGRLVFEQAAAAPEFAADFQAARAEIAGVRAEALTNPGCAAERRALNQADQAGRGAVSAP